MSGQGVVLSERAKKRKQFFKKTEKPYIRKFEITDMWVLWAAYKEGSFPLMPEMEREEFYSHIRARLSNYHFLFLVEDNNKKFKAGRGPVCVIGANTDGWKFEPHVEYFKWATKYNVIRTTLTFLNWISFRKDVGVCIIRSLKNTENLFRYMREFIGINYVGMIRGGDPRGDEFCFYVSGKKDNGSGTSGKGIHRDSISSGEPGSSSGRSNSSDGKEVSGQ